MNKFDRCIFVSIAVGIWAFVLVFFLKSEPLIATNHNPSHRHSIHDIDNLPQWLSKEMTNHFNIHHLKVSPLDLDK